MAQKEDSMQELYCKVIKYVYNYTLTMYRVNLDVSSDAVDSLTHIVKCYTTNAVA